MSSRGHASSVRALAFVVESAYLGMKLVLILFLPSFPSILCRLLIPLPVGCCYLVLSVETGVLGVVSVLPFHTQLLVVPVW